MIKQTECENIENLTRSPTLREKFATKHYDNQGLDGFFYFKTSIIQG